MPRRLGWDVFRKIYDIQPQNHEQLISVRGVGPASVRAISLIGELIYGTRASGKDPTIVTCLQKKNYTICYPFATNVFYELNHLLSG